MLKCEKCGLNLLAKVHPSPFHETIVNVIEIRKTKNIIRIQGFLKKYLVSIVSVRVKQAMLWTKLMTTISVITCK